MRVYCILLNGCIVDRKQFDMTFEPAIFFDKDSAKTVKKNYYPSTDFRLVEADAKFEIVKGETK